MENIQLKINNKTNIPKLIRSIIRQVAEVKYPYPIKIVSGTKKPTLEGKSFHWVTKTGKIVHHPNAYKRAWGKPIYVHSTRRIEVGENWFNSNFSIEQEKFNKLKVFS